MLRIKEFIKIYAERNGVTKVNAEVICKSVFATLGEVLYQDGEDVCINRVGTFRHKLFKARAMKLPTGETIQVPERDIVRFSQSEASQEE